MSTAPDFGLDGPASGVKAKRLWERHSDISKLLRNDEGNITASYGNLCMMVRHHFGERLAYNVMAEQPLLDELPISDSDMGAIREMLEHKHGVAFSRDVVDSGVRHVCTENSFHPVQRYLNRLVGIWDGNARISRVLTDVLAVPANPLHSAFIRCFFLGAVARALEPGCKLDTVLILQGKQGGKKSTFYRLLADPWFADSHVDFTTRQGLMTLNKYWLYEWGEIERVLLTRESADVKSFVTSQTDSFVPPYGRAVVEHKRSVVVVGSSNEKTLLCDPTGARRYHIIPCADKLNLSMLERERDQLWAEAVEEYMNGRQWFLDDSTQAQQAEDAERWQVHDAWREPVLEWLRTWFLRPRDPQANPDDALTLARIARGALDMEAAQLKKAEQNKLAAVLHSLGYVRKRVRVGAGVNTYRAHVWEPGPEAEVAVEESNAMS